MVEMMMRVDNGVNVENIVQQHLLTEVGRCVYDYRCGIGAHQQ
jgi:hypothetical protein